MKIVLVSDWFLPRLGGVELQLRDLAGELASGGHDVHVVTTTPADPSAQGSLQTGSVALSDGVSVHRLDVPLLPRFGITLSRRAGPAMRGLLRTIEPDAVHIHASICSTAALAGAWAADGLRLPIVVTFHSVLGFHRHLLRQCRERWPAKWLGSRPGVRLKCFPTGSTQPIGGPCRYRVYGTNSGWYRCNGCRRASEGSHCCAWSRQRRSA